VTSGARYNPPLQVIAFVATRNGDPERGPLVRMNGQEARTRLLSDGELVWVHGPRRQELAPLKIDDELPRGGVLLRDIAGVAISEIVRIVKPDLDRAAPRGRNA
jgi:anaerobic selenocysteine-containing dehydrogenase